MDRKKLRSLLRKAYQTHNLRDEMNIVYITDQRLYVPELGTIMYCGISSTTHVEICAKMHPPTDILISYYYCTDAIYEAIKQYKG
jgi:hypothetical protein